MCCVVLASRGAALCANKNTIVRTAVIIYVSFYNVRHHSIATLQVHAIIGAWSGKYISTPVKCAEQRRATRRDK
jgi:hypothetical protein